MVSYFSVLPLFLASRSAMHFLSGLISSSDCSSEHVKLGLACSLAGVSECWEFSLSNILPAFLATGSVARARLLTSSVQLLEDSALEK